jgi:hypothetical protein
MTAPPAKSGIISQGAKSFLLASQLAFSVIKKPRIESKHGTANFKRTKRISAGHVGMDNV